MDFALTLLMQPVCSEIAPYSHTYQSHCVHTYVLVYILSQCLFVPGLQLLREMVPRSPPPPPELPCILEVMNASWSPCPKLGSSPPPDWLASQSHVTSYIVTFSSSKQGMLESSQTLCLHHPITNPVCPILMAHLSILTIPTPPPRPQADLPHVLFHSFCH